MTRVAILGLGEVGRMYGSALADSFEVIAWDPFVAAALPGVQLASSGEQAVEGADIVLAMTTASESASALSTSIAGASRGAIHADCATGTPAMKMSLADSATAAGIRFVDVAIMAPVRRGAEATPLLMSGAAASDLGAVFAAAGMPVEVLDDVAGAAAARKLLRSMLLKGLTAVMIESLRASEVQGLSEWFGEHLVVTLASLDRTTLSGLLDGTAQHSGRRIEEMEAAADMTEAAGGSAEITRAVVGVLRSIAADGVPHGGRL